MMNHEPMPAMTVMVPSMMKIQRHLHELVKGRHHWNPCVLTLCNDDV
jgi:hypothetical protein